MSADTVRWRAGRFGGSSGVIRGYRLDVFRWRWGIASALPEAKQQVAHAVRVLTTIPDIPDILRKENQ